MYASHCKASVFRGYVEHKQWMQWKNWQSPCRFSRNGTVLFLSCWTHVPVGKNACEFPLSLRFTIDRKFFYLTVGSSFTERKFSDICNATKCKSENYKLQKEWKDSFVPKYKEILMNLNKGGILTFEWYANVSWAMEWCHPKKIRPSHKLLLVYGNKSSMNYGQTMVVYVLPQQRATSARSNHSEKFSEPIWLEDSASVLQKFRSGKTICIME